MALSRLAVFVAMAACICVQDAGVAADSRLIGWMGETYNGGSSSAVSTSRLRGFGTGNSGLDNEGHWQGEVEVLSWTPRVFLFKGFLSDEECQHMIDKSRPMMKSSTVVDNKTGKSIASQIRTSSGSFFRTSEDETIKRVEQRIADVSMVPMQNGEGIQILQYNVGQKYEPHFDYFHDKFNADPAKGGQRIATMLMYLTSVDEGGETVFPSARGVPKSGDSTLSQCARRGLAYHPKRGDAVLFWSLKPDGNLDPSSLHGSCPVIKGQKWSATKWMHVGGFGMYAPGAKRTNQCEDENKLCTQWAKAGECEKNPSFMVGSSEYPGGCMKACGKC